MAKQTKRAAAVEADGWYFAAGNADGSPATRKAATACAKVHGARITEWERSESTGLIVLEASDERKLRLEGYLELTDGKITIAIEAGDDDRELEGLAAEYEAEQEAEAEAQAQQPVTATATFTFSGPNSAALTRVVAAYVQDAWTQLERLSLAEIGGLDLTGEDSADLLAVELAKIEIGK